MEALEPRQMMAGPQLQSILPNEGADLLSGAQLTISPQELVFHFTQGQTLDSNTLGAIRITRNVSGTFGDGNDQLLVPFDPGRPGFIGLGDQGNEVIVRFPSALPDDMYRVTIVGDGATPLRNIAGDAYNSATTTTNDFRLNRAPELVAVVPQPISNSGGSLTQARDQIDVYFNANDPLDPTQAQNPGFYQLLFTNDTATSADDQIFSPINAVYDAIAGKTTLTFQSDLAFLPPGPGTYRLRVGDANAPANFSNPMTPVQITPANEPGSSFDTSHVIGALSPSSGTSTVVINAAIDQQPFALPLPGGNDEPGHRNIPAENHLLVGGDATQGISTIFYNFQTLYGFDPQGNPLSNGITQVQRQRVREIFEFYGHYLGAQFAETANQGITVAVGDMRAVDPTLTNGPGGTLGVAGGGVVVLDSQEPFGNSEFGGFFFNVAMHEVGHALGLGHDTELPDLTVMSGTFPGSFGNTGEEVFPGDYDIVHGQHLYRPESQDIDLYQFQVNEAGVFTAEIMAERLANSSLLDSAVTLFEEYSTLRAPNGGGVNLDGTQFVISDGINPDVTFELDSDNSFSGGVQVQFIPGESPATIAQRLAAIINTVGGMAAFGINVRAEADGDLVKVRGLVNVSVVTPSPDLEAKANVREVLGRNDDYFSEDSYLQLHLGTGRYYVGVTSTGNTNYDPVIVDSGFGGTTQGAYELRLNFARDPSAAESILDTTGLALDGDGDGRPGGAFNYWFNVATEDNTLYVDKSAGAGGVGSLLQPFNEIDLALAAATARNADANPTNNVRIVRLAANGGTDGDVTTVVDATPYAVGSNTFGQTLADGRSLDVPKGVTLIIDAGAVVKMRGANIDVGSVSQGIDRSEGYLQVLGIPRLPVVITSTRDESLGQDVEPSLPTVPSGADWGGLVFRNDEDLASPGRRVLEREGIFLNYVNGADIRYGGGSVVIGSVPLTFNAVHMIEARPTISHSTIVGSANAAMSADLPSFKESKFYSNAPAGAYTADYDRVGPDIYGNTLSTLIVGAPIGIVDASNTPNITITTATPHGLITGQRVRISGVQGNLAANGDWTITVTGNTTFTLAGSVGNGAYVASAGDAMQTLTVLDNSLNGLFVRIRVVNNSPIDRLTVAGRFDDTDITHIITQALIIQGTPGGPVESATPGVFTARTDASLTIDPGIVIKSQTGRIEAQISTQVLAEGTAANPIIFTTLNDDRYGRGGSFDTNADRAATKPAIGGWSGLFFDRLSHGSIDHAVISYGGGASLIEGRFENFSPIEINQADVRIANSMIRDNDASLATSNRNDRGTNAEAVIFVRGAQPVIVNNTIRDNDGQAININANSLDYVLRGDTGRSTGAIDLATVSYANHGPLVDGNRMRNNRINGMIVRGAVLTTESIWDDTDIVHVLQDEVEVANHHTYSGLRLQSNPDESLVIKLQGAAAGFTAGGRRLDISDRIGGTLQVVGTTKNPVVMTAISDDSVGAGLDPDGATMTDTNEGFRDIAAGTGQTNPIFTGEDMISTTPSGAFTTPFSKWGPAQFGTGAVVTWAFMGAGVADINNLDGGWTNIPLQNFMPAGFANEIRRAFAAWSAVANIKFVEVPDTGEAFGQPGAADIRVGGHGIDGPFGVLAHAFLPSPNPPDAVSGDLHFDNADLWKIGFGGNPNAVDIFNVAAHELGHAIGLGHTNVPNSLMNPFYTETFAGPQTDDIAGAVFLYGLPATGNPGAWRSVRLEQFSNDRNVVVANELENATAAGNGNNSPGTAQFVGALATDEKNSNETLRLGFEIHGYVSLVDPSDEDVYSFNAQTGTEVWFDIDRTTQSLDTVLELIDANGTILARSDDSTEELATGILPPNPFGPNLARLMQRDAFNGKDLYTINPRDAGMRVVLPGAPGLRNTYYIRVRSKGLDIDDPEGLTRGAYQLQIRLRETDEVPGSMIRNSDIRFAINGIEVLGMPGHSPLTGDASETTANNDTLANAQDLGNLLTTDRSSLSVAGNVSAAGDIDFFSITVDYDLIQSLTGIRSWATMFDIDYADGVRGGDLTLSVFDAAGNLLLVSRDSNVEEDQPGPGQGQDMDDLTRGSAKPLDPFIGTVQLPEEASRTYFIAVSSNRRLPTALNATFQANATAPLVRLEPVSSVRRVVDDHIGFTGGATAAPSGAVFAGATPTELNLHADQFQLGDVVMFVNSSRDLFTVDPLTGIVETDVTGNNATVVPVTQAFRDISMRSDGRLFGFVSAVGGAAALSDANTGNFVEIDPGTGQILRTQDDGITTLEIDPTNPPQPGTAPTVVGRDNGVVYEALDFYEPSVTGRRLFAVGTVNAGQFSAAATNQLYELDPYTGVALPDNFTPAFFPQRPPSEPLPRATLDVGINGARLTVVAGSDINLGDGDTFQVDEGLGGGPVTLEMDSGITLNVVQPGINIADGSTFTVTDGAVTVIYRFDKDPATAPPSGVVEISINDTMSAAQVAGAIASAFLNGVTQQPAQPLLPNPLNNQLRAVNLSPIGQPTRVYIEDLSPNAIAHNVVSGTAGVQVLGAPNTQTPGATRIYFTPLDTAVVVAQRIEAAIAQNNPFVNVVAVAQNNTVAFQVPPTNPTLTITIPVTTPFTSAALPGGFGGIITGMQFLDNNLFAVTNTGTLLRYNLASINGPVSVNPVVQPDFAINLNQVPFTGLSLGPQNLDVDRDGVPEYARMFFATAADGRMYAFDEFGSLQGIFADGADSVFVGVGGAQGVAFSTLDYNLWHVTNQRGTDAGHGINPSFDNSRTVGTLGGTSFYFGLEDPTVPTTISTQPGAANYAPQPTDPRQQNVYNTYNLPGGAQGSLTTDTFSLAGYTSRDLPTLYFNYFLQTQNANANTQQNMRDAFRVFISNDGVNWSQLATNNSILSAPAAGSSGALAELPDHLSTSGGFYRQDLLGDLQRVQELYDNTNAWRQARVDLGDFAGFSNLRLRFDFSTAATMNVGGLTVGQYLQALPGAQLRDGQIFSIGAQTFEFDSGFTLVVPGGAGFNIQDGETFTIDDGINPAVTFEFDNNTSSSVPAGQTITITTQDSAEAVAQKIAAAIGANFLPFSPGLGGITPHVNGHRVNLEGAIGVTQSAAPDVTLEGAAGVSFGTPVAIHEGMTDVEVARQMALVIDAQFALSLGTTDLPNVQTTALLNNARIQLPTQIVTNPGPLATGSNLQGDQFGNFFNSGRGQQNNFEGAYIDDIMVGFAERGEMVTAAPANATFFTTPADLTPPGSEQLTGDYQLEIRRGEDYGQVIDTVTGQILLFQAFDTNDRLTKDFTITLPPGNQIHEGQSFQISDGLNTVTFEFDSDGLVSSGAVLVPYTNVSTAAQLAQVVASLINSNPTLSTQAEANPTGARVNLIQASFATSGGAATNGNLAAEPNDTIATAANSNLSSNNPGTFLATGTIGDNPNLFLDPSLDVDMVSFQLNAGDHVRIDLDAAQLGSNLDGIIAIFDAAGLLMALSDDNPAPGESFSLDAYLDFVAPADGTYYVGVSGFDNFSYDPNTAGSGTSIFGTTPPIFSQGEYTLIITVGSGAVLIDQYDFTGDENQFREQGQILIDGNHISHFSDTGIRIDAGPRDPEGNIPRQPSVRNTRETNVSRLVPGVAVQNNLITNVGQVGIRFSGSTNPANQPVAAVPFGRIVNNTIWGGLGTTGVGIQVTDNASPTIVNNILANLGTGISVDNSSRTVIGVGPNGQPQVLFSGTVISANLYRSAATTSANTGAANNGLGDLPIVLSPADPLFEDESLGVFTPKKGSLAIDSSLDSVQDRPELTVVTNPLGIGLSPILAPELDLDGKLRVDDPSQAPPPGLGSNVFKDRGALERINQPLISISSGTGTVKEGDLGTTDFVFIVSLDQFTSNLVTVEYTTTQAAIGPLAAGGVDYQTQKGVLTFLPGGATSQLITVKVIGDVLDEDNESFAVVLTNATNSAVLNGQATGQIIDDDDPPTIAINSISLIEGNNPNINTPFVFTVNLSQASGRTVNVVYTTSDATATAGLDYQPTTGTLTFNPGQTRQFVTVNVFGDVIPESNETFNVTLSSPTNVTIPVGGGVGVGTILNDEPSLTISSVSQAEGNSGTKNFVFTVTLTPAVNTAITVQFATADGTATAGSDYAATSGTLTFAISQTQQTITVAVAGDTAVEADETFTVNLSNATGAGITVGTGTGTIGNDDIGPITPPPPKATDPYIVTSAGVTGGPHVHVVDAATLQTRYSFFAYPSTFTGGVQVATGDVNGDGIDDIITAPGTGGGPHVRVFSGATGQQLPGPIGSFMAFETSYNGGVFVAAGDINFDGKADLFVATKSSSSTFAGESASAARIRVFDGASGAQLREFAFRSGSPLATGIRIASGDINGDGRPEILAASAAGGGGHVLVMDPLTGGVLRDFVPYPGFNGEIFVTAGDMNRDGRTEIITGAGGGGGPQVNIYDGATNAKLHQFFAYAPTFTGGVRVGTSDINKDGVQDLILGAGTNGGPHVKVLDGTNLAEVRSYFAYAPTFTGGIFVAGSGGGSPLLAAEGQANTGAVATLTQEALQPVVQEAIARWAGANISASALERLRQTSVSIADLPDGFLGLARPDRIYVDINGAGYGWFINPTAGANEDAVSAGLGNRMDLLTAVMHEMGHVLGLDDLDHDLNDFDLMADSLAAGKRRAPSHDDIDNIFASDEDWQ